MSSPDYYPSLQSRISAIEHLRGEALLTALREIISFAKSNHDGDTVAEFARHLIEVASHQGRIDFEMIGFAELRDLYQSNPNYADLRNEVLWYYKWLAEHLPEHLDVPAEQIWALMDQMEQFFREQNAGLRPVHALRCRAALFMGLREQAMPYYELWQNTPSDQTDDCPACETHAKVHALLSLGRFEDAIAAAEPIMSGEQNCEEVPATTFSALLFPLLVVDRLDDALLMHAMVRRQVRIVPKLVGSLAEHVLFLTIIGALEPARRLNFIMLARIEEVPNDSYRFVVARGSWIYLARCKAAGQTTVKLPARTRLGRAGEPVPIDTAIAHYEAETRSIGEAFDRRNGTSRFAERIESSAKMLEKE